MYLNGTNMNEPVHETMKVQHPPRPRTLKDKGREAPRISFIGRVAGTPTALPPHEKTRAAQGKPAERGCTGLADGQTMLRDLYQSND